MKGKFTVSDNLPKPVLDAISSPKFARDFFDEVIGDIFGIEHPCFRPSEFFEQKPDFMVEAVEGVWGVVFTLSAVTRRDDREPKVFHQAMDRTAKLCAAAIQSGLMDGEAVHFFVSMMLTGDVPLPPPGKGYSNVLETEAVWITRDHVSVFMPDEIKQRAEAYRDARAERLRLAALE